MSDDMGICLGVILGLVMAGIGIGMLSWVGADKAGQLIVGAVMASTVIWFVHQARRETIHTS